MKSFTFISKTLSVIALTMLMAFNTAQAQVPTDSIVADFNEFIRLLEETHPDPYTNYGGRPFFRRAAMETRWELAQDSVTSPDELATRINEFLAPLQDGHTNIKNPMNFHNSEKDTKSAPISFRPIGNRVIIYFIRSDHKDLLGSQLVSIENVPFKTICDELAKSHAAENEIGRIVNLTFISSLQFSELKKAIPNMREDSITFQIITSEGKPMDLTLPLIDKYKDDSAQDYYASIERTEPFPNLNNMSYLFVDDKKNTMYFRSTSIMARDALEYMHSNGMDIGKELEQMYRSCNEGDMPDNTDEALAKIPSFSDEFEKMLQEMKKNKSKNLIIDLRGNGGGFTPIVIPTLYQMWGDEFLKASVNIKTEEFRLISPLLMKKFNTSLDELNMMFPVKAEYGDYIYSSSDQDEELEFSDDMRNQFISSCMSSVKDKLIAQKGKPVYTPEHVYVLTNPTTFSAAFHYAFYLWKMGATVVGLPSKQAPNTYMEMTPFELPRTGLKGSISNTLQLFLPVDDPRAKEFTPDLMPTYEDYKRYNFDDNTELLYLLDNINGKIKK